MGRPRAGRGGQHSRCSRDGGGGGSDGRAARAIELRERRTRRRRSGCCGPRRETGLDAGGASVDQLAARADGYARAEGCGAAVLRAKAEDGDADALLQQGSAVRQDGRSASLTAPNGSAQRVLLLSALGRAGAVSEEAGCIEMHGTGTALGDPTEAGALAA
ncbi:MAG: hypothetical protein VX152_11955, partial [Pseudomonadota bacterium]|nr:hypothetical protein [Pseudomonadota bacterium]